MNARVTDVFIVTYGRTGSTLLQALLNTAPGADIEGENYGFLYHLYAARNALRLSRQHVEGVDHDNPSSPFYGALRDYRRRSETEIMTLARSFLRHGAAENQICGFKETRHDLPDLAGYLGFLAELSERPHFIFLTRAHADVVASGFMRDTDSNALKSRLVALERDFDRYASAHPTSSTRIDYTDVIAAGPTLRALFERLGLAFGEKQIAAVMATQHSYGGKSAVIFMGHRLQLAPKGQVDPLFEICRIEKPKTEAGTVSLSGLLLARQGKTLRQIAVQPSGDTSGEQTPARVNLPSPGLAKQLPQNPLAAHARFAVTLPFSDRVQVLVAEVDGKMVEIATYFPPPQLPQSNLFPQIGQQPGE